MDVVIHRERLADVSCRYGDRPLAGLPDGAMIERNGRPYAVRGAALLPWSFFGYGSRVPRPAGERVRVLTPPAIVAALSAGYRPRWAEDLVDDDARPYPPPVCARCAGRRFAARRLQRGTAGADGFAPDARTRRVRLDPAAAEVGDQRLSFEPRPQALAP